MPGRSKPFAAAKRKAFQRFWRQSQDNRYESKPRVHAANYVRTDRVSINGRMVPFENRSNINVFGGKEIRVVNVGRPAAALYVPAKDEGAR